MQSQSSNSDPRSSLFLMPGRLVVAVISALFEGTTSQGQRCLSLHDSVYEANFPQPKQQANLAEPQHATPQDEEHNKMNE